jgi:hypothetical protein
MRFLLPTSLLTCLWTLSIAAKHANLEDDTQPTHPLYIQDGDQAEQDLLQMGAMLPREVASSLRHRQEVAHLMTRMDREHGTWGTSHLRHRLLEAMFAFSRYRERNMAELDRWRDLYTNVGKKQKRVCANQGFALFVLKKRRHWITS